MQSKRELKIKPAITIHDIALAPRKREKGKKKINERHSFRDSPLFLLLIHTCPNNRVFIFPQCIPRVTKLLRRWTIGHEGRRPYQGGSEVTTGNRSRIRFKDPREIVCPSSPPYSPSFLSLLNFKTSLGVSRTHTHTRRAHRPSAYIILLAIQGRHFYTILSSIAIKRLRISVALCSSTFQAEGGGREKSSKRAFFHTGNKRNQGFSNVKSFVSPGERYVMTRTL